MRTVGQICEALFELAPESMKESWDNVGLLCGRAGQPVEKVLVALDPFPNVAEEAKASGVQLLLTHHPLIFGSIQAVNDQNAVGRTLLTLIENGIAAVNLHTNLDSAPGGVNDCLASALELKKVQVLMPAGTDAQGLSLIHISWEAASASWSTWRSRGLPRRPSRSWARTFACRSPL